MVLLSLIGKCRVNEGNIRPGVKVDHSALQKRVKVAIQFFTEGGVYVWHRLNNQANYHLSNDHVFICRALILELEYYN